MRDLKLYSEAKNAAAALRQKYGRGSYRVIGDPEGVVSLWLVEGLEQAPFALQFANRGRISGDIDAMPPEFAKAFLAYVRKSLQR